MCLCMPDERANFIKSFFLLCTYTYNAQCKAACECQLCLKPRFHLSSMWIPMHMQHCSIYVFWTPLSPIFLGKACLDTEIGWLNPEFYDPGHKNMDSIVWFAFASTATWSDPFFAFVNRIHSQKYGIMLVRLYVFHFFLDSHNTYMESRLKITHHLFEWCHQLKSVFIAVYWLYVLGNLKFNCYSESENGYG